LEELTNTPLQSELAITICKVNITLEYDISTFDIQEN